MESKKNFSIVMQLLIIGVFTCFMLASASGREAEKQTNAVNAAERLLHSYGYKSYCFGTSTWGFKKGNCKATIVLGKLSGNRRNRGIFVIFQHCEASYDLKNKINSIANCTYYYNSSDYDYCNSSRGGISPNTGTSSSSSSKDCSLNHWVERWGDSYIPYFQTSGNCVLSLDYSIYSVSSDELLYSGHLYFSSGSSSPASGYSYKEPIRIVITSKKWD